MTQLMKLKPVLRRCCLLGEAWRLTARMKQQKRRKEMEKVHKKKQNRQQKEVLHFHFDSKLQ